MTDFHLPTIRVFNSLLYKKYLLSLTVNFLKVKYEVCKGFQYGIYYYILYLALIVVAVRRCYENLRRTYLEQQSGKEELVEQQAKRRKYRSRRERVRYMYTGLKINFIHIKLIMATKYNQYVYS